MFMIQEQAEENPICIREVNENIRRCEAGEELTRPLAILNLNCDFRKKFEAMDKIYHKEEIKKERNENTKAKETRKKWREENRELLKAKARYKYANLSPEEKERRKQSRKLWEVKNRDKINVDYRARYKLLTREQKDKINARARERYRLIKEQEDKLYNEAKRKIAEEKRAGATQGDNEPAQQL